MSEPSTRPPLRTRVIALGGGLVFAWSIAAFVIAYAGRYGQITPDTWPARGVAGITDIALFSAFAWHHSLFARAGLKARMVALVGQALERSAYVWIASGLFLIVVSAWQPVGGVLWHLPAPWSAIGWAAQGLGLALTALASRRLGVFELAGIRQAYGRTAPVRDAIVSDGLYGLVRHPLYMAWLLMVWPTPVMTGTRLVMATVSTVYLVIAIEWEERSLSRSFGVRYDTYRRQVRARLVPWVY